MADNFVTTKITGAAFSDGSTLSGNWTAEYDPTGLLVAVTNATFVVSGSGGTTTFNGMGTLPYANKPSNTSYEIHSTSTPVGGSYTGLYIDWRTETPSSFYEGSPSLFTSVLNSNSSRPATPLRLKNDGVSGTGTVPVISGLPASESGNDATVLVPFGNVTVTDADTATTTSATITLSFNGAATDADGVLSGAGLTKTATGTYSLAFTSPANLTAELKALKFTPTAHQVGVGSTVATAFDLSINDTDGSTSASTTLTVTAVATCFVRGTMIATPSGEAAVESLRVGDLVTVSEDGIRISRPVTWIGSGSLDVADFDDCDQAFPIRIRKDAFADDVPYRDLLVTQEHCILTQAGLTPARMLVNGRSIVIDRCTRVYDFFHVELESHAILLAEGLAAESYLDTGNRDLFINAHASVCASPATTMAAPLAVARTLVEPIWTRLRDRARGLGFDGSDSVRAVTDQPDLRLLLDDGRELSARWHNGQRHMFHIPCGTRPVRLLSRAAVPADVVGPFVDDRRTLGVAVDKLVLWSGLNDTVISVADLVLDGWHAAEGTHRWTNGRARLHLPEAEAETFLDVHLNATALYSVPHAA